MRARQDPRVEASAALAKHPLLKGCGAEVAHRILARSRVETYKPRDLLIYEGQPALDFWFLTRGTCRVFYTSPEGFEVTVKIFGAPADWAEMELLNDSEHIEGCVAVDSVTVVRLPKAELLSLLRDCPPFALNLLHHCAARFFIAAQNERSLAFLTVEQRLASYLLALIRLYGVPVARGTRIRVRLSQEDLAHGVGAVRRSVVRALSGWQKDGVLSKDGNSYVIHDVARLTELKNTPAVGIDWVAGSPVRP